MKKNFIVFFGLIFLAGCAKLAHLQELLTLKSLSDNQTTQHQYIQEQNKKFEALLDVIKNNRMSDYPDKKSFLRAFGEPIFSKTIKKDGKPLEKWLYRYAQKLSGHEKVYLYFDSSRKLLYWDHVQPDAK